MTERVKELTKLDEVFARKVTDVLGKNPEVSDYVQGRLDVARDCAINLISSQSILISQEDTMKVSSWWEKHSKSLVNTAIAFSVVFLVLPFGLNFQTTQEKKVPSINYVVANYDYFDEDYHRNAEADFNEDELEENDFI